jgi:hypothetical protein
MLRLYETALKRMIHGPPWSDSFSLRPPSARRPLYSFTPLIHDVFSPTALFATTMLTRTLTARYAAAPASNANTTASSAGCYRMHIRARVGPRGPAPRPS